MKIDDKPVSDEQQEEPENIVQEWKPKPFSDASFGLLGFNMVFGVTKPPQKPDDEPLQ